MRAGRWPFERKKRPMFHRAQSILNLGPKTKKTRGMREKSPGLLAHSSAWAEEAGRGVKEGRRAFDAGFPIQVEYTRKQLSVGGKHATKL